MILWSAVRVLLLQHIIVIPDMFSFVGLIPNAEKHLPL
jgi:hypothetical protein